jgi:hypothetical protein
MKGCECAPEACTINILMLHYCKLVLLSVSSTALTRTCTIKLSDLDVRQTPLSSFCFWQSPSPYFMLKIENMIIFHNYDKQFMSKQYFVILHYPIEQNILVTNAENDCLKLPQMSN